MNSEDLVLQVTDEAILISDKYPKVRMQIDRWIDQQNALQSDRNNFLVTNSFVLE
jgi:hypothetical protein